MAALHRSEIHVRCQQEFIDTQVNQRSGVRILRFAGIFAECFAPKVAQLWRKQRKPQHIG